MNALQGRTFKSQIAAPAIVEPEVSGGENVRDELEIGSWQWQDKNLAVDWHHNESPPYGRSAVEYWGDDESPFSVNIRKRFEKWKHDSKNCSVRPDFVRGSTLGEGAIAWSRGPMSQSLDRMVKKHVWTFQARFRAKAYGWKGSSLAIKRLKEAVSEIKRVSHVDAVLAAEGAVTLFERFWPSLEQIDSSSGALGGTVNWVQEELIPLVIKAPADRMTRDKWLQRLWQAIQDDGVSFLSVVEDRWGELCVSPEVASHWADQLIDPIRMAWSDPSARVSITGTALCFSSLLAAGRHEEIWKLLEVARFPFWSDRRFGVDAYLKEGRIEEALAYAESSRWQSEPEQSIDAACERILLECGRSEEAYLRYALPANQAATGIATFRAMARKYPGRDPATILVDLVQYSGDPGRYFAAAKDAGFYDMALRFAKSGRTDPRTLSRAARDYADRDAGFAMEVGRLALEKLLLDHGYDVTPADVHDAYERFLAAAHRRGMGETAMREAIALANLHRSKLPNLLADALLGRIGGSVRVR